MADEAGVDAALAMHRLREAHETVRIADIEYSLTPLQWRLASGEMLGSRVVVDGHRLRFSNAAEDALLDVLLAARDLYLSRWTGGDGGTRMRPDETARLRELLIGVFGEKLIDGYSDAEWEAKQHGR